MIFIIITIQQIQAENSYQVSLNSYNYFTNFEHRFLYSTRLKNDYLLNFSSFYTKANHSLFKQNTQKSNYLYQFEYTKFHFKPYLQFDFTQMQNSGLPGDNSPTINQNQNNTGFGFKTDFYQTNFFLDHSTYYLYLQNSDHTYQGIKTDSQLRYSQNLNVHFFSTGLSYLNNNIYLNRYQNTNLYGNYTYQKENRFDFYTSYDNNQNDIYTYANFVDKTNRDEYITRLDFYYLISTFFTMHVTNNTNYRLLDYQSGTRPNSQTTENLFTASFEIKTIPINYFGSYSHNNHRRISQAMTQTATHLTTESREQKIIYGGLINSAIFDTLKIEISNYLLQNIHSSNSKSMDNDRLLNSYSLQTQNKVFSNIIKNSFRFLNGEQRYLASSLSAYNHKKENYLWVPELNIYLCNPLTLNNNYKLEVDYEDYVWENTFNNKLYRSFYGEWGILYHHPEIILSIYPAFAIENTETAEYINHQWYRWSNEYIRYYFIRIEYQNPRLSYSIVPLLKYYTSNYEIEMESILSFNLPNSRINSQISTMGNRLNYLVWNFVLSFEYIF